MTLDTPTSPDWLHLPGSPGYDAGRTPWNLAVQQHPAAVATPRTPDEAAAAVRVARERSWRVAPQTTGHAPIPLAARGLDDVLLVRTSRLVGVEIDPASRRIRAGAGTPVIDIVTAAERHGLTIRHGSAPDIGIAGYATGGGLGFYGRTYGLAADQLVGASIVTPDGELVHVDDERDPDGMWGLRGGRANLGLITEVELQADVAQPFVAGMLLWDASLARDVLRVWRDWCATAPDAATTSFRILRLPPIPGVPPFLLGRAVVVIDGAVLGEPGAADRILGPLRAIRPELDTFAPMAPSGLPHVHMDPTEPMPGLSSHALLRELPDAAIDAFLDRVGYGVESPLLIAELRQLGGAVGRQTGRGAVDHIPGDVATLTAGVAATPELAAIVAEAGASLHAALEPWSLPDRYLNFADEPIDPASGYSAEAYARLRRLRAERDPEGVFVANHAV